MTFEEAQDAEISIEDARRECRRHGADLRIDGGHAVIFDADNGDVWGRVEILDRKEHRAAAAAGLVMGGQR